MHPYLAAPGSIALAHRGGAHEWPQNSLAAFEGARALGFTHLETDVRITRDGVLVVFHDPDLAPSTDRSGLIEQLSASEVTTARIRNADGSLSDQTIPTLEALLDLCPDSYFNLDAKADAATRPLIELIGRRDLRDRVCLASFSRARLRLMRDELGAGVCTANSPAEIASLRLASWGLRRLGGIGRLAGDAVQLPIGIGVQGGLRLPERVERRVGLPVIDRRLVNEAERQGKSIHVWTVNNTDRMGELLDLGAHGIITDRPSALLALLRRRGQWPT